MMPNLIDLLSETITNQRSVYGLYWYILFLYQIYGVCELIMYIIDRFEGDLAILERKDRSTFKVPRTKLPKSAKEGGIVTISWEIDERATKERKNNIEEIMNDFFDK